MKSQPPDTLLPDSVISLQDLKAVTVEVRQYAKWYSQYAVKAKVSKEPAPEPSGVSAAAAELIHGWAKADPTQKSLDALIQQLDDLARSADRVTITLAAPAPASLQKQLVGWCRQNIAADVLVSFRFNSTLLGGMVVQHGSHVYDWSFRRQILTAGPKFAEVLRNVR